MYDIAIIGGGPAGATLARLIGKKYKVVLLEKRTFKRPLYSGAQKCCGGLLDPDAQKMLATLGFGLPKSVIRSPQMFAVRTIDIDNSLERYYQRHYINIDREEFDIWLESLIPSEVDVINGALYHKHEILDDRVEIIYYRDGETSVIEAGLIIGADGAFSKVRRNAFPDRKFPDSYVAIQEWFKLSQDFNCYGAIFDSDITDFYSWLIPKEEYLIVGSALIPDGKVSEKFELLKNKLEKYGFFLNNAVRRKGTHLYRTQSANQICIGNGRVALLGEAAGFISPSSAEGVSYAFRSAVALAMALGQDINSWLESYRTNTAKLSRNIVLKNLKSPFMYNRVLRKFVMISGLQSIDFNTSEDN